MPLCCVPLQKEFLLFACNGIDINVCIYMCDFFVVCSYYKCWGWWSYEKSG